jgi:hypothetical protein
MKATRRKQDKVSRFVLIAGILFAVGASAEAAPLAGPPRPRASLPAADMPDQKQPTAMQPGPVWVCGRCLGEVGRAHRPNVSSCPHCGTRFRHEHDEEGADDRHLAEHRDPRLAAPVDRPFKPTQVHVVREIAAPETSRRSPPSRGWPSGDQVFGVAVAFVLILMVVVLAAVVLEKSSSQSKGGDSKPWR